MGLRTIHSGVSQLEGISKLDLSNNSLSDLGGVRSIEGVRWLQAKHNRVTTTRTVRGMTELRVLNLGHNRLATLDGLSTLKQLRAVLLNNNELAGALSLPSLPFLSSLILSHNKIENIEGGSGENLPQLRKMSLSHNQLTSLPDLSSIPTLQEVRGAYNSVSEIPNWIRSCHALKVLDLGHNAIAVLDAGAAVALRGCMSLQNLNLAGNPVCETEGYRSRILDLCPTLEILDGRKVEGREGAAFRAAREGGRARERGREGEGEREGEREGGRKGERERKRRRSMEADPREIFLSNLPYVATERHVRQFLSDMGPRAVSRVQILPRSSGGVRHKGVAFVKLRTPQLAQQACEEMQNRTMACSAGPGEVVTRAVAVRPSWRNVHRKPTRKVEIDEEEGGEDVGGVAVGVGESGVEEREEEKVEEEGRRVLREKARRHASMMTAGVD